MVVLQCPCGIDARHRSSLADPPRSRVILVFAPLASGTRTDGVLRRTFDEDQTFRVEIELAIDPVLAPNFDVQWF
jgi:hypothetical protein